MSTALTTTNSGYTDEQIALITRTVAKDASQDELALFLEICRGKRLNPFSRQIYAIKRGGKLSIETSIDGFRLIAQRTGKYAGQLGPFWCGPDGVWKDVWLEDAPPAACRIGILHKDFQQPLYRVARYKNLKKDTQTWRDMPDHMLAVRAEAYGLRASFPEELSGLYTHDEMEIVDPYGQPQVHQTVAATHTDHVTGEVIEATPVPASEPVDADTPFGDEPATQPAQFDTEPLKARAKALGFDWKELQRQALVNKRETNRERQFARVIWFLETQETSAWLRNPEVNQLLVDLGVASIEAKEEYLTINHFGSLEATLTHLRAMREEGDREAASLRTTGAIPTGARAS